MSLRLCVTKEPFWRSCLTKEPFWRSSVRLIHHWKIPPERQNQKEKILLQKVTHNLVKIRKELEEIIQKKQRHEHKDFPE